MLLLSSGRTTPPPAEGQGRVRGARRTSTVPGGCAAFALFATCGVTAALAATDTREFILAAGTQRELLIDAAIERLAVADEAVASVLVTRRARGADGARLIVTGKAPGRTTLMVWRRGADTATTYEVVVRRTQGVVEGSSPSLEAHARRVQEARAAGGVDAPIADRSIVQVRSQTVQVEVKIVEFSRSVLKEAGVNLSSYGPNSRGFSFLRTPSSSLSQAFDLVLGFGNANQGRGLDLTLRLLQGNGLARVLAEPTLVATSGQSASFLSGGELPVPVPQALGATTIQYKPFGIGLTVTPTVLSNDRIALKVAPEASDLDYTNAVSVNGVPVPSITTRRADTAVELGDGESFVIGGLVSRSTLSNASKVPFLGDLPVIGLLFKQNNYRMNEKELVIVVTPHLVRPIARGTDLTQRLPGGAEQRDGNVWNRILLGDGAERDALPGFSR